MGCKQYKGIIKKPLLQFLLPQTKRKWGRGGSSIRNFNPSPHAPALNMQFTLKFPTKNEKTDEKYPKLRTELRTFEKSKYITALPTLSNLYAAASAAFWPSREFGGIAAVRRGGRKRERERETAAFMGRCGPPPSSSSSSVPYRPPPLSFVKGWRHRWPLAPQSLKIRSRSLSLSLSLCSYFGKQEMEEYEDRCVRR